MSTIAIGQAGGPTAVINASLVGFLEGLDEHHTVYGIMNGYQGLAENDLELLEGGMLHWVLSHRFVPGACLGSGRFLFTEEKISQAVRNLKKRDIHTLVFIGGNGTMAALQKISHEAKAIGYELQVIGIPKTVDNDLAGTDHAPGFGSAARYVALSTRDISKDLEAMRNFEQVRIIETMGRNAGWLAAASGFLKQSETDGPHLVCIPEVPIEQGQLLQQIKEMVREYGIVTIVVSEGVTLKGASQVKKAVVQGRSVLGGISKQLEDIVREHLGLNARAEILGMNQRSSIMAISSQDQLEAYETGKKAAEILKAGKTEVMVAIQYLDSIRYTSILEDCPLEIVASKGERLLPEEFISNQKRYFRWLKHLIGDNIPSYPPALRRRMIDENLYSGSK
ncbi:diphosphate--fructose-6-phosphate 1-phosphotransferase [Fodinisporobacter ferrooxydans]|uniref:Diphosphate--fructose-6-phosphate 1-phosphotransferase n=1 Tax=Fodinisporobacter ferrooxydans TaxID=2901836 RepID=A0ABY4CF27_9BACL|nr:diphosphate--fructose-6-phosphate 1-phosphotransferase [Alicyclobacillaceae bacterium MYW30-H2]